MSKTCGECTYLDLNSGDIYGKFYCDKRWERHLATDVECSSFCLAYSRDYTTIKNATEFSKEKSSSESCYLTTMLCNILGLNDNNIYLNTLRNFRNNYLYKKEKYNKLLVEYDVIGPKIANYLKEDPLNKLIAQNYFNTYIVKITNLINNNNYNDAIDLYITMTNNLKNLYNIENRYITIEEINNADIKKSGHGYYVLKKSL